MTLINSNFPWTDLSEWFDDKWLKSSAGVAKWTPAVNVIDHQGYYEIEVAAPGIKKDDFKISYEKGKLTISGELKEEQDEKNKNYTRKEFSSKSFSRSFTLPENVNEDGIQAKYENGILRLTLNKTNIEAPKRKEIAIG